MATDVKRAYFYAPASRPLFIDIPEEDLEEGDEGMVGQLQLSLYGTRDAAANWTQCYTDFLKKRGFEQGRASPCNFYHREKELSLTVHGDDFTTAGTERALAWLKAEFEKEWAVKTKVLGPGKHQEQEIRVLNRIINWTNEGITYEAAPRHAERVVAALNLEQGRPVVTPGCREDVAKAA